MGDPLTALIVIALVFTIVYSTYRLLIVFAGIVGITNESEAPTNRPLNESRTKVPDSVRGQTTDVPQAPEAPVTKLAETTSIQSRDDARRILKPGTYYRERFGENWTKIHFGRFFRNGGYEVTIGEKPVRKGPHNVLVVS